MYFEIYLMNSSTKGSFQKNKTLKVVEVSTRGGGGRPHFHKKKMKKKCFFKEIFNLVQNGLVHPKMQR
jgi:hypothetical protein